MCKLLIQSRVCGHHVTVKTESCFLVENKFQCTYEEKKVRQSRYDCSSCRRQQWEVKHTGAILLTIRPQRHLHSLKGYLQKTHLAETNKLDPATVIANLKALCAKGLTKTVVEETPEPEAAIPVLQATMISASTQAHVASECLVPNRGPLELNGKSPARKGSFSDFLEELDPNAYISKLRRKPSNPSLKRCQDEDQRPPNSRQPWTRDGSNRVDSSIIRRKTLNHSASRLPLPGRGFSYRNSPLSLKPSTDIGNETDSAFGTTHAVKLLPSSRKRRNSSNISTASARSAKKKINEMLSQEFEETAYIGDIVLQSPEFKPFHQENHAEYDPAQSYLAFVERSGYGQ